MSFHLAELLEGWAHEGDLVAVSGEIDAEFELAEAAAQVWPRVVLCTSVRARRFAVIANLWGTEERIYRALGAAGADEVCERWRAWFAPETGWLSRLASGRLWGADKSATRGVRGAACQQVVELGSDVNLAALPWLRAWPQERLPGTAAAVVLLRPPSGETYVGLHALQCVDAARLCVAFDAEGRLARLLRLARGGPPVPGAIVLGPPPELLLAATASLPEELDRWQLAAAWQAAPVEMVHARSVDLEVPAHAELIIEGHFDSHAPLQDTGPLAGPYGWYVPSRPAAVFQTAALTRRANPVLPLVSQGPQPHELETVYAALARLLKPLARGLVPQLVDYSVAAGAGTGRLLTAAIRKRQAFDSRQAAGLLWGWGHWLQARLLILVDEWVDVHDLREVLLAVAAHLRPERDVWSLAGPEEWYDDGPGSSLHHALVLDATCKSAADAAAPGRMVRDPSIGQRVERLLQGVTAERVAQQRG